MVSLDIPPTFRKVGGIRVVVRLFFTSSKYISSLNCFQIYKFLLKTKEVQTLPNQIILQTVPNQIILHTLTVTKLLTVQESINFMNTVKPGFPLATTL